LSTLRLYEAGLPYGLLDFLGKRADERATQIFVPRKKRKDALFCGKRNRGMIGRMAYELHCFGGDCQRTVIAVRQPKHH
jgi:hypothetical protein